MSLGLEVEATGMSGLVGRTMIVSGSFPLFLFGSRKFLYGRLSTSAVFILIIEEMSSEEVYLFEDYPKNLFNYIFNKYTHIFWVIFKLLFNFYIVNETVVIQIEIK